MFYAQIHGSRKWFRGVYAPYIVRMARLAQAEGVEIFSVGSELRLTLSKKKEWLRVIRQVRRVYRRNVTYVANHDSYTKVPFWGKLDYISLSAWFRLGDGRPSPGMEETKRLWERKAQRVDAWRIRTGLKHKEVLLAEAGAMSKGEGVVYREPWNYDAYASTDFYEQQKIYEGLLAAFMPKSWCKGVIFYNWEIEPSAGRDWPTVQGYTPQNKPAVRVMARYWRKYA